jgi:uncharacterized protein with GYD domain
MPSPPYSTKAHALEEDGCFTSGSRRSAMARYLYRFGYTPEAWKALMENPQDRRDMLASQIFGTFGGRLEGFWYCFGEQDGYALVELPDKVSAAAASVAVAATGSFRHLDTTVLISVDEMVEAMDRASSFRYSKPGN